MQIIQLLVWALVLTSNLMLSAVTFYFSFSVTGSVALVADCGRISFQTVRWLMRETNLAERASPAINATQCQRPFFLIKIDNSPCRLCLCLRTMCLKSNLKF